MYQAIIIDDEKWVIKSLISTIENQNFFDISGEFYDGYSALSYIREHKPDLAFVDVQLAGINGLEILNTAKTEKLPTLFIVISGHAEFAYAQKALFHNAISYCLKPFSRNELMDSMQKAYSLLEERKEQTKQSAGQNDAESFLNPGFSATGQDAFLPPEHMNVSSKRVRTMLNYISEHYAEELSIQTIADLICITPNYASQLFKEKTNFTFNNYLTTYRMHKAASLLRKSDMAIFMVASLVGYKDYFYFAKVFKKTTGYTPTVYRNTFQLTDIKEDSRS